MGYHTHKCFCILALVLIPSLGLADAFESRNRCETMAHEKFDSESSGKDENGMSSFTKVISNYNSKNGTCYALVQNTTDFDRPSFPYNEKGASSSTATWLYDAITSESLAKYVETKYRNKPTEYTGIIFDKSFTYGTLTKASLLAKLGTCAATNKYGCDSLDYTAYKEAKDYMDDKMSRR
jgi:hypothetical protein